MEHAVALMPVNLIRDEQAAANTDGPSIRGCASKRASVLALNSASIRTCFDMPARPTCLMPANVWVTNIKSSSVAELRAKLRALFSVLSGDIVFKRLPRAFSASMGEVRLGRPAFR